MKSHLLETIDAMAPGTLLNPFDELAHYSRKSKQQHLLRVKFVLRPDLQPQTHWSVFLVVLGSFLHSRSTLCLGRLD